MNYVPLSVTVDWGTPNRAKMFFLKFFKTFVIVIFSKASVFIHLVKYLTTTIKYLSWPSARVKGLRRFNPHYMNDHSEVRVCILVDGAMNTSPCHRNLSHLVTYSRASLTMVDKKYPALKTFLAKEAARRCFLTIPSCTSRRVYLASSFSKHLNIGVDIPLLYRVPPTIIYMSALFFTMVAADGSGGRLLCSMYFLIKVIQEGEVGTHMVIMDFYTSLILDIFLVSWMN